MIGSSVALTNVNVEIDGNAAEGVMTYANNGRQTLQATLAAGTLDFTPYVETIRLLAGGARDWNRQLFDLHALSATDLDMRLSAAKVIVGSTRLGSTALGANLRNGSLALSIGEAQIYGGIAKGSFGISYAEAAAEVKAQFQLIDVDLQTCVSDLFGTGQLSGRGNLNIALEATGSSPFGLAQSLDGTAGSDRPRRRDQRVQCRAIAEAAGAAAAFRRRQFPQRKDAVRRAEHRAEFRRRHRDANDDAARRTGSAAHADRHGVGAAREYDLKGVASLRRQRRADISNCRS